MGAYRDGLAGKTTSLPSTGPELRSQPSHQTAENHLGLQVQQIQLHLLASVRIHTQIAHTHTKCFSKVCMMVHVYFPVLEMRSLGLTGKHQIHERPCLRKIKRAPEEQQLRSSSGLHVCGHTLLHLHTHKHSCTHF